METILVPPFLVALRAGIRVTPQVQNFRGGPEKLSSQDK